MTCATRFELTCVTILLAVSLAASPALSKKPTKIQTWKAQTTHSFANGETEPAFGLKVVLSKAAEVKTDDESGQAGPFRDVRGNGTNTIELMNPVSPIEPGSEAFDLVFGTYEKKIKVESWLWLDSKAKKIGKKNKDD